MFKSWFTRKKKQPNPYILESPEEEESTVTVVKRTNSTKGYYTSPYNKNYPSSGSLEHKYKPITTSFANPDEKSEPTKPVTSEVINDATQTRQIPDVEVDHYETAKFCELDIVKEQIKEEVQDLITKITDSEHPSAEVTAIISEDEYMYNMQEPVTPAIEQKQGFIFVMNGYGVEVKVEKPLESGEDTLTAYIDTGTDVNIEQGQKVKLSHWNGIYDNTIGIVVKGTDTEREGNCEEVLIQNV